MIYIQNPEETEDAMRQRMEDRYHWVLDGMNSAADFHELPYRFAEGAVIKESSEYWTDAQVSCGEALSGLCTDLAAKYGRQEDYLEMWLCVLKTQYFTGCQGVARGGGNLCMIGEQALFNDDKIGVFHELGHNLGCPHQSPFCPKDVDEFVTVNKKLYKTIMGGGGGCNDLYDWKAEGIEKIRALYFTDSKKKVCENGVCQSLGDEEYDCVNVNMKDKFAQRLREWYPACGSDDELAKTQSLCSVAKDMTCDSRRIGKQGAFPSLEACAEFIKDNPDKCSSGMFFYAKARDNCRCCQSSEFIPKEGEVVLMNQDPIFPEDYFLSFKSLNLHEPIMPALAFVGAISSLYVIGKQLCFAEDKYANVPDMDDV